MQLWDARKASEIPSPLAPFVDLDGQPLRVAYSPTGRFLAIVWREFNGPHVVIRLWDVRRQATVYTLRDPNSHDFDFGALAFSPDGTLLAASIGSDIVLWNVRTALP